MHIVDAGHEFLKVTLVRRNGMVQVEKIVCRMCLLLCTARHIP